MTDLLDPGDPGQVARELASRFVELHGVPPSEVAVAPGRVNLIGEHVDYAGGWCLPVALPHATYAAARPRADRRLTLTSRQQDEPFSAVLDELDPEALSGWPAYAAGTLWALEQSGVRLPGLDVVVDGRVPLGAGLSSSAALECSVALVACAAAGVTVDEERRHQLVEVCMRAEREAAGAPTGGMDQVASLRSRAGHALLLDCRSWQTRHVPWQLPDVDLLVVDTRASHALGDGQYAARRADCEAAAAELGVALLRDVDDPDDALRRLGDERLRRRARHVFGENARVLAAADALAGGDLGELGRLFVASHASLRDDYEVSAPELDLVVDTAVAAGAHGARMTGGGFGGSAIVLVGRGDREQVREAVAGAFAERGLRAPGFLLAEPAAGARALDVEAPPTAG